jgi:hypothetical protein
MEYKDYPSILANQAVDDGVKRVHEDYLNKASAFVALKEVTKGKVTPVKGRDGKEIVIGSVKNTTFIPQ